MQKEKPYPTVIENRWTPICDVTTLSATEFKNQLQELETRIRGRLRLRLPPFSFQGVGKAARFRAVGIAGSLSLKGIHFEIAPKFLATHADKNWNISTLFLLEFLAGRHVTTLVAERQKWSAHSVFDQIAHAFADAAERGLREQPIRIYKQIEVSSQTLHGRLNIARQLRNVYSTPHILECDTDELHVDNPFNAVLKWAAECLERAVVEPTLKKRLKVLALEIPGRAEVSAGLRHLRLTPPPQYQAWANALELARILAGGLTLSSIGGSSQGYTLLFNMERAFEKFVEAGLSQSLCRNPHTEYKAARQVWSRYGSTLDAGGHNLFVAQTM